MFSVNQSKCIHLVCISGNFKSKQSLRADKQQRGLTRNNQCLTKHFTDFHMASNRERSVRFYGRAFFVSAIYFLMADLMKIFLSA